MAPGFSWSNSSTVELWYLDYRVARVAWPLAQPTASSTSSHHLPPPKQVLHLLLTNTNLPEQICMFFNLPPPGKVVREVWAQLRGPHKLFKSVVLWYFRSFKGILNFAHMMPGDASLSKKYTSNRSGFSRSIKQHIGLAFTMSLSKYITSKLLWLFIGYCLHWNDHIYIIQASY